MRWFFGVIGAAAWIAALAVFWIFKESGGALTIIAAGTLAIVAVLGMGCERILKTLEDIRDARVAPNERVLRERKIVEETRHAPAT